MLRINQFADSHIHCENGEKEAFRVFDKMKSVGVTDGNLLAYTHDGEQALPENNLTCLYYKKKYTDIKFRVFGSLYHHPRLNEKVMPFKEQAELLLAMGCDGMKFLDMKPDSQKQIGYTADDVVYDELYDMLEEKQIPLVIHVADPAIFWNKNALPPDIVARGWCYDHPSFLTKQQLTEAMIRRLEKNPRLQVTFAHFFFLADQLELLSDLMEKHPNMRLDLTPAWQIFADLSKNIMAAREFFLKYRHRILYGTDICPHCFSWYEAIHETQCDLLSHNSSAFELKLHKPDLMRGMDLDAETQSMICYHNFFELMGHQTKQVNLPLFLDHAKTLQMLFQKENNADAIAWLAHISAEIQK